MIFLFCSARSGSTWLGKIFDSHPDVIYLHEPDITDRGLDLLPYWFEAALAPQDVQNAKTYLQRIVAIRNLRTIGTTPFFRKNYRGPVAERVRRAIIYGTKVLERFGSVELAARYAVPDLAFGPTNPTMVVKSVGALGRANALLSAAPDIKAIQLIRHPCGFVDSMLRGNRMGVMERAPHLGRLACTESARRLGVSQDALEDEVAVLSWTWLLSNLEAYDAVQRARGQVVIYEDLARRPLEVTKSLFQNLGLPWSAQTDQFVGRSQESEGDYYSVFRNPEKAMAGWRENLDRKEVDTIRAIVSKDPLGRRFFEDH